METPSPPNAPPRDRFELAAFLAGRDAPCPVCGYNLRGLLQEHCPECGRHLVLAVGTTEPKLGAFILGLVGLAASWGFCALLLLFAVIMTRRGGGPNFWELLPLLSGAIVPGAALLLWVSRRRVLGRQSDEVRWWVALGVAGLGLAFPIWFILSVR